MLLVAKSLHLSWQMLKCDLDDNQGGSGLKRNAKILNEKNI